MIVEKTQSETGKKVFVISLKYIYYLCGEKYQILTGEIDLVRLSGMIALTFLILMIKRVR